MPIFGADHTEPEGSNFDRASEDFGTLRKAVKEIDSELKKSFKYFKGMYYLILKKNMLLDCTSSSVGAILDVAPLYFVLRGLYRPVPIPLGADALIRAQLEILLSNFAADPTVLAP